MEQEEIWRDIEGYERLYRVSNLGRVKSLERIDRHNHLVKEKILKPAMGKNGYLQVGLHKEGKVKRSFVHRLVAQAFIPNPEGLPVINHRDENKTNNVVFLKDDGSVDEYRSNLEWCTVRYNTNYGTGIERMVQTKIRNGTYDPEMCGIGDEKERHRLYHQKNREQILEQKREYYQKNRDQIIERVQEYYQSNREKKLEHQQEYRQNNRGKINERERMRYQNNREKILEQRRDYYQKNKEKKLEYQRERYRLKKKKNNRPSEESLW